MALPLPRANSDSPTPLAAKLGGRNRGDGADCRRSSPRPWIVDRATIVCNRDSSGEARNKREFRDYANRFAQVVNFLRNKSRLGTLLSATYDLAIDLLMGRRRVARRSGPLNIRGRGKISSLGVVTSPRVIARAPTRGSTGRREKISTAFSFLAGPGSLAIGGKPFSPSLHHPPRGFGMHCRT